MKCERCGEREVEIAFTNLVRTEERNEARSEQLCRVCANVDPDGMRTGLARILEMAKDLPPEDRGDLEGLADVLKRWPPDTTVNDSGQDQR
jgi:hypothetical protein